MYICLSWPHLIAHGRLIWCWLFKICGSGNSCRLQEGKGQGDVQEERRGARRPLYVKRLSHNYVMCFAFCSESEMNFQNFLLVFDIIWWLSVSWNVKIPIVVDWQTIKWPSLFAQCIFNCLGKVWLFVLRNRLQWVESWHIHIISELRVKMIWTIFVVLDNVPIWHKSTFI